MENDELEDLLDHVELCLEKPGCDNTHRHTREWAIGRAKDPEEVIEYVAARGGCCCDCEVLLNVRYGSGVEVEPEPETGQCELFGPSTRGPLGGPITV